MNELERLEKMSDDIQKTTSNLKAISSDLRPYSNLVRVLFVSLAFSLLTLGICVYFAISVYGISIQNKTEMIFEYEENLKKQGKVIITEKRLNEFKDYYEFFSDLDDLDSAAKETLKTVRKSIERWHKKQEQGRKKNKVLKEDKIKIEETK